MQRSAAHVKDDTIWSVSTTIRMGRLNIAICLMNARASSSSSGFAGITSSLSRMHNARATPRDARRIAPSAARTKDVRRPCAQSGRKPNQRKMERNARAASARPKAKPKRGPAPHCAQAAPRGQRSQKRPW